MIHAICDRTALEDSRRDLTHSFLQAWRDPEAQHRLCSTIRNGLFKGSRLLADQLINRIDIASRDGLNDKDFIKSISDYLFNSNNFYEHQSSLKSDENARIKRRVEQISKLFPGPDKPKSIMDIGCGNGHILSEMAREFGIDKESTIGVDVHFRVEAGKNFTYLNWANDKLPYPSDSIEFATALMALHHDSSTDKVLKEIHRVLKPGALLLIREHDAATKSDHLFCRTLDLLYSALNSHIKGVPQPANYRSESDWRKIVTSSGFEYEGSWYPEPESPIKPFFMIARKLPSLT